MKIQARAGERAACELRRAHVPRRLQTDGEVVARADDVVRDPRYAVGARSDISRVGGRPAAAAAHGAGVAGTAAIAAEARWWGEVEG